MSKKIFFFLILIFLLVISSVSAEFWACFAKGEEIDYCNPKTPDRTCKSSSGCLFCMSSYNDVNECYNQGNWLVCNTLIQDCDNNGGGVIDVTPPNITVNSPVEGEYYNSRAVLFDIEVSEISDIYYYDNINGRGRWSRLCTNCIGYSRSLSFEDGINDITIKATDGIGNAANKTLVFYVDSKEPKIHGTEPEDGEYGNGDFIIEYTEENLQSVMLYYRIDGDWQQEEGDCEPGERQLCTVNIELEGQFYLEYYFSIADSAQTVDSSIQTINIDTIDPVLTVNSPHNPIQVFDTKKVPIDTDVTELVLLEYIDYTDRRPKFKRLCRNCDKFKGSKSFRDGFHNVTFRATDEAGNEDIVERLFIVDSKKPRIKRSLPKHKKYGNGVFTITYDEENPKNVTLFYKQGDAYQAVSKMDCPGGKNVECSIAVEGLAQGEVYYYFAITDIVGLSAVQRKESLVTIDTLKPYFINLSSPINTTYNDRKVWFTANVSEKVTLEYINHYGSSTRWKRLCSKCEHYNKYKTFRDGDYYLTIRARDNAGNSVAKDVLFSVER